ncbi:hypothetical protein RSAG8_11503, partial [Rhizoctonia solani AG-8 WAC10335]
MRLTSISGTLGNQQLPFIGLCELGIYHLNDWLHLYCHQSSHLYLQSLNYLGSIMPDPTPNELPNETQVLENLSLLTGVYFDASTGPVAASCPAVVINSSSTERIRPVSESVIEDIYPENELDAHHARLGWPPLSRLPERPWSILTPRDQRPLKTEIWASRRFMMQKWTMNISPRDLSPVEPLVEAVKDALGQRTNALRIRALREVFITWGEMIPVNVVVGACLVATGTLNNATTLPDSGTSSKSSSKENQGNLVDVVDRHLGTTRCFARRLETRVQGGSSDVLLTQGHEAWLQSVTETASLRVTKVNHAVPITEVLDSQLRERVEKLFINSIILRSPGVGEPLSFGFDGAASGLRNIERVTLWLSDAKIRDISVAYAGGVITGPYSFGLSNPLSQTDVVVLASGEYITDIFVWQHNDGWIAGIQFVKNSLECSPIYGMPKNGLTSRPPILLSGDGNALLGISGTYTSDSLNQIKAVWRSDVVLRRQRHTRTSFTGGLRGVIFNDLQHLADPATARIVQISACSRDGDGTVCNFRVTYESTSGGSLIRSETPFRGSNTGPRITMTLEEGEHIIGVRGSHNDGWIFRLQFVTNRRTHPAFGTATGQVPFSFDAPKTLDGRDMVLHYMVGK